MFNSNVWPNSAPLRDTKPRNLSDLDFDLSMSFKVKCDFSVNIWFPIGICSNYMSISHRLAPIATQNVFSYLLPLRPNHEKSQVHRMIPK